MPKLNDKFSYCNYNLKHFLASGWQCISFTGTRQCVICSQKFCFVSNAEILFHISIEIPATQCIDCTVAHASSNERVVDIVGNDNKPALFKTLLS